MPLAPVSPTTLSHAALTEVAATRADWTDGAALALFLVAWAGYPMLVTWLGRRHSAINIDMIRIREFWMREMAHEPERRLLDGQLLGHTLNTANFFASTNLIMMAAVAGALFGGERTYHAILDVPMLSHAPRLLFEFKLILVLAALAGGLLDFIWSIRQLSYCLTLIGAAPSGGEPGLLDRYATATGDIFNRAQASYNAGVRAYYFALAASAWLIGPIVFAVGALAAVGLLLSRQLVSPTARAMHAARLIVEELDIRPVTGADQASTPTPIGQTTPVPPMPQ